MKLLVIKEILDRCPIDKKIAGEWKCDNCQYRGTSYMIDKPDRPFSYKVICKYKKRNPKEELSK